MGALPPPLNTIVGLVGLVYALLICNGVQDFCNVEGLDRVVGEAGKAFRVDGA